MSYLGLTGPRGGVCLSAPRTAKKKSTAITARKRFEHRLCDRELNAPLEAIQYVRRMRGGSQPHLVRCSDGKYYVAKCPNNPQGIRILANELLCASLAARLGLPIPVASVIHVRKPLINLSTEMIVELSHGRVPCRPGMWFGSQYPGPDMTVYDVLPNQQLKEVDNISDFAGMLVFDLWTSNADQRQVVFYTRSFASSYHAAMIDNGFCLREFKREFRYTARLALYDQKCVYSGITSLLSFDPWLTRLETGIDMKVLIDLAGQIPCAWYESDFDRLFEILEGLNRRRKEVRRLLRSLHDVAPAAFPNWNDSTKGCPPSSKGEDKSQLARPAEA